MCLALDAPKLYNNEQQVVLNIYNETMTLPKRNNDLAIAKVDNVRRHSKCILLRILVPFDKEVSLSIATFTT